MGGSGDKGPDWVDYLIIITIFGTFIALDVWSIFR